MVPDLYRHGSLAIGVAWFFSAFPFTTISKAEPGPPIAVPDPEKPAIERLRIADEVPPGRVAMSKITDQVPFALFPKHQSLAEFFPMVYVISAGQLSTRPCVYGAPPYAKPTLFRSKSPIRQISVLPPVFQVNFPRSRFFPFATTKFPDEKTVVIPPAIVPPLDQACSVQLCPVRTSSILNSPLLSA